MTTLQTSEQILIARSCEGDLDAFNQLVLQYEHIVYRYAASLVGDTAAAEDITQESFIKVFQHIRSFHGGSFRAWLLRIVTNTSHDLTRRFKRHPTVALFPEGREGDDLESPRWIIDENPSVESIVQMNEEMRGIQKMLDELPAVYRSVLTLIDIHELDYVEAAQVLHIPLGTVKSRLTRARLQMKDKLQKTEKLSSQKMECLSLAG